ncbi:Protein HLJ1 [Linum perenne]
MECNKEEAVRAKSLAEVKLQNKDFSGARKMAIKAQQLYKELDKIDHILVICEVHYVAERKIRGTEMDWYGILQIEKTADDAIIKKQYRKFALLLHPDKNNFPGAEAAFKLIGEAQRVLLDKGKRSLHDMKCKSSVSKPAQGPSYNSNFGAQNGFRGSVDGFNYQHHRPQQQATQSGFVNSRPTFWTACPFCQSRYQYYTDIINRAVVCQNCRKTFMAYEKSAQGIPTVKNFTKPVFQQRKDVPQGSVKAEVGSQGNTSKGHSKAEPQKKPTDGVAGPGKSSGKKRRNKESDFIVSSDSESSSSDEEPPITGNGESGSSKEPTRRSVRSKQQVSYKENRSDDEESKTPQKKAKGNGSTEEDMQSSGGGAVPGEGNKLNTDDSMNEDKETPNVKKKDKIDENDSMRSSEVHSDSDSDSDAPHECPDSEFNDFEKKRDVNLFKVGKIWAIYDDFNGMPRFYARIQRVSPCGLKFKITWLEAETSTADEEEWVSAGLPVSCGKFKLGNSKNVDKLSQFSHQVEWEKGNHSSAYRIVPRKGEIWALFKNWDIKWKSQTDHSNSDNEDDFAELKSKLEYDFVEIMSNFSDNEGVSVLYLGKLKGFVSLFCRISNKPLQIKPTELLRFSHQVPSFTMTGKERDGVPEGSFELDPAALPEKMEEIDAPKNSEGQDGGGDVNLDDSSPQVSCEVEPEVATTHDSPPPEANGTHAGSNDPETDQAMETPTESDDSGTEQVLDPEFFDFDAEKSIEMFEKGQIWSLYCEEDSLPKYYAQVTKVVKGEESPKIFVKWLKSSHLPDVTTQWTDKSMVISCGRFKVKSGGEDYDTATFSHLVNAEPEIIASGKTQYNILPLKGEVWAMYRDWTPALKPSDLKTCDYDVVEVLEKNDQHIKILHLVRVKEHNSVFRASAKHRSSTVDMSELLRFSHRIPAFRLTEEHGSLNGYWELDSAALPARYFA